MDNIDVTCRTSHAHAHAHVSERQKTTVKENIQFMAFNFSLHGSSQGEVLLNDQFFRRKKKRRY